MRKGSEPPPRMEWPAARAAWAGTPLKSHQSAVGQA